MKKKYTLEDVQKAAADLSTFVQANLGKTPQTDPLIEELSQFSYELVSLIDATSLNTAIKDVEIRHHATVMQELKAMGNSKWPGMYVMHDLICAMAHFGFTIRYAIKDADGDTGE